MATPKPTKKTIKEPKFHPHYDDPSADIIFASNDGIHFGISLRLLAKTSTVFADMKSLSGQTASMTKGQPIDINCGQAIALQFLELVSVHKFEPIISTLDFDTCKALFSLIEQYDCSRLRHPMLVQLVSTAQSEEQSWDLFKLGSIKEDWSLGRYALRQMNAQYVAALIKSVSGFHDLLCELRPEWHLTLSSIILDKTYEHRGYQPTMDWATLASKFIKPGSTQDNEAALREEQLAATVKAHSARRFYDAYA